MLQTFTKLSLNGSLMGTKKSGGGGDKKRGAKLKNKRDKVVLLRPHNFHSSPELARALKAAQGRSGSLKKESVKRKIPFSTLRDAAKRAHEGKKRKSRGRTNTLTDVEEDKLCDWLVNNAKRGTPITPALFCAKVQMILVVAPRKNPFGRECLPGRQFVRKFHARHRDKLGPTAFPRNLERVRAGAVNAHSIAGTYAKWRLVIKDVLPEDIWNQDEQVSEQRGCAGARVCEVNKLMRGCSSVSCEF